MHLINIDDVLGVDDIDSKKEKSFKYESKNMLTD